MSWRTSASSSCTSTGPRRRRDLHPRRRLVDQVDRLVGQEAAGDVAVGQLGRGDDRLVGDRDLVVRLERVAQAAQDHDGLRHRRLRHEHRLEAPLQRRVLLDVLLVLVERGGADQVQLAAGERRLEHVGDVEPALAAALAGADDGVDLVDEQDQLSCSLRDLLEDLLHAFLELAAVLRARDHRVDRELDEALVAQRLRHLAGDDALGQALDDGGLADARLADQHRVVLLAPGQHLDGGLDLLGPADHRVELALAGELGEVAGVFVEVRRVGRRLDPAFLGAAADHLGDLLADRLRA